MARITKQLLLTAATSWNFQSSKMIGKVAERMRYMVFLLAMRSISKPLQHQ